MSEPQHQVELASGKFFDIAKPDHKSLTLNDIATPLSREARFNTSADAFFSVAEHSVLVASKLRRLGAPLQLQFAGLHHDDAEFLIRDIPGPVKPRLGQAYKDLTRQVDRAIWRALGWPEKERMMLWTTDLFANPLLKAVDAWAARFEAEHLTPSRGRNHVDTSPSGAVPIETDDQDLIECLEPPAAKLAYLDMHFMLLGDAYRVAVPA